MASVRQSNKIVFGLEVLASGDERGGSGDEGGWITSDENGPRRIDESTAPSDWHQSPQHSVGYLIGIKRLISFVDLDKPWDDGLHNPGTGTTQAHDQSNPTHCRVDRLPWDALSRSSIERKPGRGG